MRVRPWKLKRSWASTSVRYGARAETTRHIAQTRRSSTSVAVHTSARWVKKLGVSFATLSNASGRPVAVRHPSSSRPRSCHWPKSIGLLVRSASRVRTLSQCPAARAVSNAMIRAASSVDSASVAMPASTSIVAMWAS